MQPNNVIDLRQARERAAWDRFFNVTYPARVRAQAIRIRQCADRVERVALSVRGVEWAEHLASGLEREIEKNERFAG